MSFFPKITTAPADGPSVDAFGRQRVGEPFTLFDSKQLIDGGPLFWATQTVSGSTINWMVNRSSTILTTSGTVGSQAIRQTKRRFNYQPGKSLFINQTFVMGPPVPGIRKDVGYFDENDGIYFQQDMTGTLNFVRRSNVTGQPVDIHIPQSLWNLDRFDGTGPSGIVLNPAQAQILAIDMQWLGAGRVRMGFEINGVLFYAHQFSHANQINSVFMSKPNLPVRAAVICQSGSLSGSLEHICASVISEAGYDPPGLIFSANRSTSSISVDQNAIYPLLSLRMMSGSLTTNVLLQSIRIISETGSNFLWQLFLNPTINGGTDNANWTKNFGSSLQYDISRTTANTLSGGILLDSGYGTEAADFVAQAEPSVFAFGSQIDGTQDQVVLGITYLGMGSSNMLGAMTWRELP
jgi:hypothetical protein